MKGIPWQSSQTGGILAKSCSNKDIQSKTCCHASSECDLFETPEKLMLRSGKMLKRGRFLPVRRRAIQVQLFLVPPMIVYEDEEAEEFKVVHLDSGFSAECDKHNRSNVIILRHKGSSRRVVFEVADQSSGLACDWVADIGITLKMCAEHSLPDCADFMPFEHLIDDFHEAFKKRDYEEAQKAVRTMEATLHSFLKKYADNQSLNHFAEKYQAWLELASSRLSDLRDHVQRRRVHCSSGIPRTSDSEGKTTMSS